MHDAQRVSPARTGTSRFTCTRPLNCRACIDGRDGFEIGWLVVARGTHSLARRACIDGRDGFESGWLVVARESMRAELTRLRAVLVLIDAMQNAEGRGPRRLLLMQLRISA